MLLRTWHIRHKTSLYSTIKHSFILYWFIAVDTKPHFTKTSYKKHPLILYWFIAVPFDLLASNLLWCSPEGMRHTVWCKTSFHQNTQPLDFIFICFCKNKWIYLIHNPFVLFHLWCASEDMRYLTQNLFSQTNSSLDFYIDLLLKHIKGILFNLMNLWPFHIMPLVMCSWGHGAHKTSFHTQTPALDFMFTYYSKILKQSI